MGTGKNDNDLDMKDEYDFSAGSRGKYAKRYSEGTNLVRLDPDLAVSFPDSEAVNCALRELVRLREAHQ
jgi:hypothetical protein